MQQTLKDDVKFGAALRILKQWRDFQGLSCILYPEVLDSIVQMTVRGRESLDECLAASIVSIRGSNSV